MPRRTVKDEEDSGSDWDSVSEMDPPPKKIVIQNSALGPPQRQPAAKPRTVKQMTFVDPQLDSAQSKEGPPFDFKSEVKSPIRVSDGQPPRPGKQRKGKLYDSHQGSQRHVSFFGEETLNQDKPAMNERIAKHDSDSEDPLYSTVKPRDRSVDIKHSKHEEEHQDADESTHRSKKKLPKITFHSTKTKLQGIDNKGYVGDDQASTNQHAVSDGDVIQSNVASPVYNEAQTLTKQRLPSRPSQNPNFHKGEIAHDASYSVSDPESRVLTSREDSPPLILTVGESLVESAGKKPVEAVSRAMGEAFALITFPFTCFTLFLHHLLRFLLQGVVRPLLVDTLTLIVEYLVRPFISNVVKPLLTSLHGASVSLSDTLVVCMRPLTVVLQSVRLVEINHIRRYYVEEV